MREGQNVSVLVDLVIEGGGSLPVPELVAYFKGARIALRVMQGIADERDPPLAVTIGNVLRQLPGGDNPGHDD